MEKASKGKKERKSYGFFSRMSDNELYDYISKNHSGKTITKLAEADRGAFESIRQRRLIEILVDKNILIRKSRPRYFSQMTDEELVMYVDDNYRGLSIKAFIKKDSRAYTLVLQRGLLDSLISDGSLIRIVRKSNFFKNMTDDKLIEYMKDNWRGQRLVEFERRDGGAYNVILQRKLVDRLCGDGILIRTRQIISEEVQQKIIELVKTTAMLPYSDISPTLGISGPVIASVIERAIKEGKLNPEYRRPYGKLYLENVRQESQRTLEGVLS